MRTSVLFVLFSAGVITATPVVQVRQYFPEEHFQYRENFMFIPDGNGQAHFIDLTEDVDDARASDSDVTYHLYTRTNPLNGFAIPATNTTQVQAENSPYKPSNKNFFIVHGWQSNFESPVNTVLTAAVLEAQDANVFVVDWSEPASHMYIISKAHIPSVGKIQGNFINFLKGTYGLSSSDFILSGFSLGAHVAGCAGAAVDGQVSAIVGLDPALPLYSLDDTDERLDPSDGEFVQVIHTNAGRMGFASSIGDSDFFPNGGGRQPGCGIVDYGCSHARSYMFYAESIRTSGFLALRCDNYDSFSNSSCISNKRSYLGEFFIDRMHHGDFFLTTGSEAPFALGTV